jgi:hypothetical protein
MKKRSFTAKSVRYRGEGLKEREKERERESKAASKRERGNCNRHEHVACLRACLLHANLIGGLNP